MRNLVKYLPLAGLLLLTGCNSGSGSAASLVTTGWTWLGGSNQSGASGVYGSQGTPASGNVPGARYIAISWVDDSGNFWLFGGLGFATGAESGNLNDLWEFNPQSQQWVWVSGSNSINVQGVYGSKGVESAGNIPGGRFGSVSWRDTAGNLWLFGGFGNANTNIPGALNDLWKYIPGSNQWTWVSGAQFINSQGIYNQQGVPTLSGVPAARIGSVTWTDAQGNLWLFGGAMDVASQRRLNDLWKFDPTNNLWTWVGGESTINQAGIYGIQGHEALENQPGARLDAVSWLDESGNFWLFGGNGVDAAGNIGLLNDLWRFNPHTKLWAWISGSNFDNAYGTYGMLGVASVNSIPGARKHRVPLSWTDTSGNLWMFGGDGHGASTNGILNDLWSYNPNLNQWTWVSGSQESNMFGVYGTKGSLTTTNLPGARMDSVGWVDSNDNLWVFGGSGNGVSTNGYLNDLWKFTN